MGKAAQSIENEVAAKEKVKAMLRRRKTEKQQASRLAKSASLPVDDGDVLGKKVRTLEADAAKREEDLIAAQDLIVSLMDKIKEQSLLIAKLQEEVAKPTPVIEFGERGQQYSAMAFRFGAKLLNCKIT